MKYIKIYEDFEEVSSYLRGSSFPNKIPNYKINKDGSIDIDGDIELLDMDKIKFKFNKINGKFDCSNLILKTLENCPEFVNGNFDCSDNELITLLGGPSKVNGIYDCSENCLKDMYGFPDNFSGKLYLEYPGNDNFFSLGEHSSINPVYYEIIDHIPPNNQIRFIYWLNTYQVIRNHDTIIKDRFLEALHSIGMNFKIEMIEDLFGQKSYKFI